MDKDISNCTCNRDKTTFFVLKGLSFLFPNHELCWRACE